MRFDIVKCHGSGNDFPLIDARAIDLADAAWAAVARALADRRGTIGGDGLLLLTAGDAAHPFGMRMFNADGSEAETCLNGLRCVARAGLDALGIAAARVRLKMSSAQVERVAPLAPGVHSIRETVGPVGLDPRAWPIVGAPDRLIEAPLPMLSRDGRYSAVALPNPHLIRFVEAIDDAALTDLGQACEAAPAWLPNRANVSFVVPRGGDLFVRTFERGVGLTNSCGSAMAAAAYVACLTGRLGFGAELTVFNAGGQVRARAEADGMVMLAGNATFEWRGSVEVDLDAARAGAPVIAQHYRDEIAAWDRLIAAIDSAA